MEEHELTTLQFTQPQKGEDFKLYLYDAHGFHTGAIWFTSGKIRYPDEQTSAEIAKHLVEQHLQEQLEVRITNGGDLLVFHAQQGKVLYPASAELFWENV
jgi:hypothetical protein